MSTEEVQNEVPFEAVGLCSATGCSNPGKKSCVRCKSRYYCSRACQSKDWSSHKQESCKLHVSLANLHQTSRDVTSETSRKDVKKLVDNILLNVGFARNRSACEVVAATNILLDATRALVFLGDIKAFERAVEDFHERQEIWKRIAECWEHHTSTLPADHPQQVRVARELFYLGETVNKWHEIQVLDDFCEITQWEAMVIVRSERDADIAPTPEKLATITQAFKDSLEDLKRIGLKEAPRGSRYHEDNTENAVGVDEEKAHGILLAFSSSPRIDEFIYFRLRMLRMNWNSCFVKLKGRLQGNQTAWYFFNVLRWSAMESYEREMRILASIAGIDWNDRSLHRTICYVCLRTLLVF